MAGRIPVCCVVGFPLGAMDTASKAFEAKTAIENGAAEVDMVINIGRLKNKEYDAVREDIRAVKQAVGDKVLKVIIETCLLTDEEKEKMCDIVCEAAARSRLPAAFLPWRTWRPSLRWVLTVWAPPALSKF